MPALAIFRSVAEQGSLEGAEASEARRLGSTPGQASGDVRLIATSLYTELVEGTGLA
jgi:hypothetical protein